MKQFKAMRNMTIAQKAFNQIVFDGDRTNKTEQPSEQDIVFIMNVLNNAVSEYLNWCRVRRQPETSIQIQIQRQE